MRSMAAAARRAERDAERRQKQFAKQQMTDEAADAVADWQERMHDIVSLHVDSIDDMDWDAMLRQPEPREPHRVDTHEAGAFARLEAFQTGFWDFLRGGSERRRQRLQQDLVEARDRDDDTYRAAIEDYRSRHSEWKADTKLAHRLLAGEIEAQREVISEPHSLSEEGLIGTHLSFRISEEFLHAIAHVHSDEVVPKVRRKQLQSGRLSETRMPAADVNELYQDYVCSVALRVAGDLFALLPRDELYVTCVADMLDRATGHQVETPILSVRFIRDTFRKLSLAKIDPSDSMRNFVCEMNFKRSSGFAPVAPLRPLAD
jgi:hypothetical protein